MKHLFNMVRLTLDSTRCSRLPGMTQNESWNWWMWTVAGKKIGEPKATKCCSVEELKKLGIVGVYTC
jgi:hypothetical protein